MSRNDEGNGRGGKAPDSARRRMAARLPLAWAGRQSMTGSVASPPAMAI